jgi:hypothetical protein|nr:MAG TPA: hypothetical protein [Caudoviricetes sp.]
MAKEKKITPVNYNGTDAQLRDALFDRNLYVPLDENNKLIRKHAISLLQSWEDEHRVDTSRKVRVIFHKSMSPSGGPYVFLSLNNKTIQAPYEKPVDVPEYMLTECCDRAVTLVRYDNGVVNAGGKIHKIPTYPYTRIGYVDELDKVDSSDVAPATEEQAD